MKQNVKNVLSFKTKYLLLCEEYWKVVLWPKLAVSKISGKPLHIDGVGKASMALVIVKGPDVNQAKFACLKEPL
jgi:hypothetical protein